MFGWRVVVVVVSYDLVLDVTRRLHVGRRVEWFFKESRARLLCGPRGRIIEL